MKYGLTEKQSKVFNWIKSYINKHGYAPSYTEIMVAHNMKTRSHAHKIVTQLEQRKWIAKITATARSITIL